MRDLEGILLHDVAVFNVGPLGSRGYFWTPTWRCADSPSGFRSETHQRRDIDYCLKIEFWVAYVEPVPA
jgi:hypothetical protein